MALSVGKVREAKPQLGEFDREILCADCDHKLGSFDDYAMDVCKNFERKHRRLSNDVFEMDDFDGEKFAKFILAVLWRASISKRKAFSDISLGPYENQSRDVLFGAKSLQNLQSFEVLIQRYTSPHLDMEGIYTLPERAKFTDLNTYGFMLSGFRIMAKLDRRPLKREFATFVINTAKVMRGFFVEFEKTSEFDQVKTIAANHMLRTGNKQ